MAFTVAARNSALDNIGTLGTYVSLHTADPGTTGASEVTGGTYARVATTWSSASGGSKSGTQVTFNVPASTTITNFGIWSAASGGTFVFGGALSANQTFSTAGTYLLTVTFTD